MRHTRNSKMLVATLQPLKWLICPDGDRTQRVAVYMPSSYSRGYVLRRSKAEVRTCAHLLRRLGQPCNVAAAVNALEASRKGGVVGFSHRWGMVRRVSKTSKKRMQSNIPYTSNILHKHVQARQRICHPGILEASELLPPLCHAENPGSKLKILNCRDIVLSIASYVWKGVLKQ